MTKVIKVLLTRSSSAVRLGVRIGACGTLGSLPRVGGKGSRGKPLHISFKEDILFSIFRHTLEHKPGDRDHTGDWRQLSPSLQILREKTENSLRSEGDPSSLYCLIGFLVVFALRSPPMVWHGQKMVFGNYWSLREFEVDKHRHRPLNPDTWTCNSVKQTCVPEPLDRSTTIM